MVSAPTARATPADLLALAHGKWLAGERLDLGKLAEELSVGRATVFRWAGSREQLYGEVLWIEIAREYEAARKAYAALTGAAMHASVSRRLMKKLRASEPMQRFIAQDPAFAMRVLFSSESAVEQRMVSAVEQSLAAQRDAGHIAPAMALHDLAYVIVRIAESLMYRDVISGGGERPNVEAAALAIELLVAARAESKHTQSTDRGKTARDTKRSPRR